MGVNIYYDPATLAVATGTPRQWRVQLTIERDGVATVVNQLFPDYLATLVSQGYVTQEEVIDKLGEIVVWAARKRLGI